MSSIETRGIRRYLMRKYIEEEREKMISERTEEKNKKRIEGDIEEIPRYKREREREERQGRGEKDR